MSLCLCTLHKDFIFISGDSRGSYYLESEKNPSFATTDNVRKIFHIGDKVVFISGFLELMTNIIEEFEISSNQSIDELVRISQRVYDKWKIDYPEYKTMWNGRAAEFIVATIENDKCVIYSISSYEDCFEPHRYEGGINPIPATLGAFAPEALKDLKYKLWNEIPKYTKNNKVDFYKMYLDIYSKYPDETMGGYMSFFTVSKSAILQREKVRIPDKKEIKRVVFINKEHCSRAHGFQIDQNAGTKENPIWDNVVYISNEGHFTIDGGWIKLLTENHKNQIFIDPEKGISIQANIGTAELPNWENRFYVNTDGNLIAKQLRTSSLNGDYITLREQYIDFWNDGLKKLQIGFTDGFPYMIWGAGSGNFRNIMEMYKNTYGFYLQFSTDSDDTNGITFLNNDSEYPEGVIKFNGAVDFSEAAVKGLGVSGSFETADGETVTVKNGLVIDIS